MKYTDLGFQQEIVDGFIIRKFENSIDEHKLYWHKDKSNRTIYIIQGKKWAIQMDNELPKILNANCCYYIKKETWHRLIKGNDDLILLIKES